MCMYVYTYMYVCIYHLVWEDQKGAAGHIALCRGRHIYPNIAWEGFNITLQKRFDDHITVL